MPALHSLKQMPLHHPIKLLGLKAQALNVSVTQCHVLQFKCLMMRLDPSEEDSDDSGNGGRDSPMAEGQMVDLEVVIPAPPPLQPPLSPI